LPQAEIKRPPIVAPIGDKRPGIESQAPKLPEEPKIPNLKPAPPPKPDSNSIFVPAEVGHVKEVEEANQKSAEEYRGNDPYRESIG